MRANILSSILVGVLLAACNQPTTTPTTPQEPVTPTPPTTPEAPGDEAVTAFSCLELTLDAPETVAPGEGTLTLTATNGCDETVEARLARTPPFTFHLTTAGGEEVWVFPDGSQLDDITRSNIAPGEEITFSTDWTGEHDASGEVVPAGAYLLHGTLRLLKADSVRDIGTLETPPQQVAVLSGTVGATH